MAGSSLDCGCVLSPDPQGGTSIEPCAQHQLDPRGLAQVLADTPPQQADTPPAATYSGNPGASAKDAVRFKLGDTGLFPVAGSSRFFLTDGEVNYLLGQDRNQVDEAVRQGCYAIMAKAAQMRDESNGSVSISWGQVYSNFSSLLDRLARQSSSRGLPFAGGISRSRTRQDRANPDRIKPSFTRDLMQNPDDPEEPLANQGFYPTTTSGGGYV